MFKVFEDQNEYDDLDKLHQGSLFHTIEYEISGILNKIENVDQLSMFEISDIITRQHSMILNYDLFLSGETRAAAQKLFTSKIFLRTFIGVCRLLQLSQHEKICINKLAYDYYITPDKDKEISDMLYQLTTEVNGKEVVVLSGIIGRQGAQILSMIRNSSFKEEKCIHRVNTFLIKYFHEIEVKDIISIYCYLFERFTPLFIYSMMESAEGLNMAELEVYQKESNALVAILNSLSSKDMESVIADYAYMLNMVKNGTPVRFYLKGVKSARIEKCIKELEYQNIQIM